MVQEKEEIELMIEVGQPLREIEGCIDEMPLDEEAKAALWLRAYASQPGFERGRAVERAWQYHRVAGE